MRSAHPVRLSLLACSLLLVLALAGCGSAKHPLEAKADNNGVYVRAAGVTYQLQVSRELNPFSTEDHQYLTGLPIGTSPPSPDQLWYGVFLWAKNLTHRNQQTASSFDIVDTSGERYYPVALDGSTNGYAWNAQTLEPLGTQPGPDTTAYFGPTQGALVLFKLNASVYANRPLTLEIHAPGASRPSTMSLDL